MGVLVADWRLCCCILGYEYGGNKRLHHPHQLRYRNSNKPSPFVHRHCALKTRANLFCERFNTDWTCSYSRTAIAVETLFTNVSSGLSSWDMNVDYPPEMGSMRAAMIQLYLQIASNGSAQAVVVTLDRVIHFATQLEDCINDNSEDSGDLAIELIMVATVGTQRFKHMDATSCLFKHNFYSKQEFENGKEASLTPW